MDGGGIVEEIKKISFGFDEKIKLIDMFSEDDDDFLVADHPLQEYSLSGLRLSGFENSEIVQEKGQHCDIVQQTRPSLAWDSAFFNSAGVLEPDELSFINEGFKTSTQDVRNRRSTTTNGDGFCSDNWFEIEPFKCKSKSTRSGGLGQEQEGGLRTVKAVKKIDKSFRNKMKYKQTPNEKSTKLQIEEKLNKKTISRIKQCKISSPNPPKATLNRTKSVSTRSNNKDLSRKFDVKMENKSATTNLQSPKHNSSQSQATAEILKPSGIRPPSPRIRFFDEMTPPRYQEVTRSRKMPPKVSSQEISATAANTQIDYLNSDLLPHSSLSSRNASAYKKLKSPCSESAYNIKRTKTDHTQTSFPLTDKRRSSRKKLGPNNSSFDGETDEYLKKKKFRESHIGVVNTVKRAAHQENVFENQVDNLNKYFEAIDLKQGRKKHINCESDSALASMRTPLAEKNIYLKLDSLK